VAKRQWHHRTFAGFMAALFGLLVLATPAAIIYSLVTGDDNNQSNTQEKQVDPSKQLQGKPMPDFTPVTNIDKLEIKDLKEGNGATVKAGDTVTVDYTGAVAATGIVFQSSKDSGQPVTFPLSGVIAGWSQGVPGMKEGGTRRLLIPASLAYGPNPPAGSGIPVNADLVFDITLHKVGK
jgi:FKBP-type peptidyl-prolyl cis-trans isomerase